MSQNDSAELDRLRQQVADLSLEHTLFRALLDSLPFAAYTRDAEGRFVYSNRVHRRLLGVSSNEEARGKTDHDFFPPEDAAGYVEKDQQILASGQPMLNDEESYITDRGEIGWVVTNKYPVFDEQGDVIGLCGTNQDVTARKAEQEALHYNQELVKLQQETLLELSTPIIPIMDGILVMPIIGGVDTARARDIMRALLAGISQYRAQIVILDITGVPVVDSGVAEHLNKTVQAAQLKGTHTIVTGITDAVAETIVDLGIDWSHLDTLRDLQSGLLVALEQMNIHLDHRAAGKR